MTITVARKVRPAHPQLQGLFLVEVLKADGKGSPDRTYKTMNLAGIFVRELGLFMRPENSGRFYHDGRFQTLHDVVDSYNQRFGLGLTEKENSDLVEYLKSL